VKLPPTDLKVSLVILYKLETATFGLLHLMVFSGTMESLLPILIYLQMLQQKMPPVHPGEILKEMYLDPLGISITDLADNLGVARKTVSQLVNGHMGVSAEMALRLGKAFNTTPELWLNMQRNYDLWEAGSKIKVSHIRSLRTKEQRA
jgi:addiction module HigA family antidote